ncbi:uncharacterized protein [Diadema antillarum]|uniref:uncharacterized protein n=1 Tax=Diadema antillarum TaxID=105358 RepID=UPI003A860FA5
MPNPINVNKPRREWGPYFNWRNLRMGGKQHRSQVLSDTHHEPNRSSNNHRERSNNIRCVYSQDDSNDVVISSSSGNVHTAKINSEGTSSDLERLQRENKTSNREKRDEGRRASTSGVDQEAEKLSSPSDSGWWNYFKSLIGNVSAVLGFSSYRPILVTVMTQYHESTVDELMKKLRAARTTKSLPLGDVKFLQLPEHGLDTLTFPPQTIDVMILCCSIKFRRFSITDVPDALYDVFLSNARRTIGRDKIAVIAHDIPPVTAEVRRLQMANFKINQPSTFEAASLVMMCGNLGTQLEMDVADWLQLEEFIINASKLPHRERLRNNICVDSQDVFYDAVETLPSGGGHTTDWERTSPDEEGVQRENERNDVEHRDEGTRASTSDVDQEAGNLSPPAPKVPGSSCRPVSVTVMTQSRESTVDELMKKLRAAQTKKSLPLRDVKFLQLPEHGLDSFTFPQQTIDVMILCSSFKYRRCAITDVDDALYGLFLANARRIFGREKIAVIAHDFPPVAAEAQRLRMANFKIKQPSIFEAASLVMMCSDLGTQLDMDVADWLQLEDFIINASKLPFH